MSLIKKSTQKDEPLRSQVKTTNEPNPQTTGTNLYASITDILVNISTMKSVWQERRKLKNLSDDQLRDIGVSWQAAELESNRRISDIPEERRRVVRSTKGSKIKELLNAKT